jgi:hypothetical protein
MSAFDQGTCAGESQLKDDMARDHLQKLIVELLRAVARRDDPYREASSRATSALVDAVKHLKNASKPLGVLMEEVVSECHRRIESESEDLDGNPRERAASARQ